MPASPDLSFETPRVRARLLREDDLDLYLALYTDPDVMRHIGPVMSGEEARATFEKAVAHSSRADMRARYWALLHRRTGEKLGIAAVVRDVERASRGEVGLMLLPGAQRSGVGTQVLCALCDHVLVDAASFGLDALFARHAEDNLDAGRLLTWLGFSRHGDGSDGTVVWTKPLHVFVVGEGSPRQEPSLIRRHLENRHWNGNERSER